MLYPLAESELTDIVASGIDAAATWQLPLILPLAKKKITESTHAVLSRRFDALMKALAEADTDAGANGEGVDESTRGL